MTETVAFRVAKGLSRLPGRTGGIRKERCLASQVLPAPPFIIFLVAVYVDFFAYLSGGLPAGAVAGGGAGAVAA
ncbi:hypothetical protein [Lautropia mirabilis]